MGPPLLEGVEARMSSSDRGRCDLSFASPLQTRILEERSNTESGASGASTPGRPRCLSHMIFTVPEEVMQPPSGLGQPGGKCPVTAWVWLAPGLQACTLPQTHSKGAAGEPVREYTACCLPCFLHCHQGPTKGLAEHLIPGLWLLPSLSSSFQLALTTNTCFLLPGPDRV